MLDYSELIDNQYAFEVLKFSLSFYNYYQLQNFSMKISSSCIKNNSLHIEGKNKKMVFKNIDQKSKLQRLVSLVLSKLNSDSLNDLRTFMNDE
jgi:hypothetical protein